MDVSAKTIMPRIQEEVVCNNIAYRLRYCESLRIYDIATIIDGIEVDAIYAGDTLSYARNKFEALVRSKQDG